MVNFIECYNFSDCLRYTIDIILNPQACNGTEKTVGFSNIKFDRMASGSPGNGESNI